LPDWRDEVCTALDFWIAVEKRGKNRTGGQTCIGRARPGNEPGWYVIDLRGTSIDADQAESLRLSGDRTPGTASYPVKEAVQDGPVLRVRVAEFVSLTDAYLWQDKQPAAFLLEKLRESIAGLGDAGLAHDLAARRLAPRPRILRRVAGFSDKQQEACESCLAPGGVRLVWGPPGTGKTMVLAEAICAMLATDRRVLLVSPTNIAVDNALLKVIAQRRHKRGQLLRVGTPHHPDVIKHQDVCLPDMVRDRLTEVQRQQQALEERLLEMRRTDEDLSQLLEATAGFDPSEYGPVANLIAQKAAVPDLAVAAAEAGAAACRCRQDADLRLAEVAAAERRVQQLAETRSCYAEIDRIQRDLDELAAATDYLSGQALTERHAVDQMEADLNQHHGGAVLGRLLGRGQNCRQLRTKLGTRGQQAADLEERARAANELLARRRSAAGSEVERLMTAAACSRADVGAADTAHVLAREAYARVDSIARQAEADLHSKQQALLAAEALPQPTETQRTLVENAERNQWPALAARAAELQRQSTAAKPERNRLEAEYAAVQQRFDRLRRDAEGAVIRHAQVIATTLAKLRTSKALMDGPYDVVLVDETGSANLPEILLAVSRAKRTAVLLGDFLQLSPITTTEIENARRPDVQRWLGHNVFEYCGIVSAQDANGHEGCTVLDAQHRFGPEIMRLANVIAYDGTLKPGRSARPHDEDDPEIVLIDTDGLEDLATVRSVKRHTGWWPAGALLSRVLADYHQRRGEQTGIITPYRPQADATLEALRDHEAGTSAVTEVGTAHRFQGREFPIVVFDLVEDEFRRRWMADASRRGSTHYRRNGVRLFTVAVTRAKTRLYLICSLRKIKATPVGTPLGHVAAMLRAGQIHTIRATELITPTATVGAELNLFYSELAEVLAEHVQVAEIHDEGTFFEVFSQYLNQARGSIWIWAPWTAKRVKSLLPVLADAVGRGVRVTLFVRDPGDYLQGRPDNQRYLAELRAVLHTVVEINVMHQKIVVIDEKTVLLGSLNVLSQSRTREVMLVMRGAYFARKLLEGERAADFAAPPRCGICRGTKINLRRSGKKGDWTWQCYDRECPSRSQGDRQAWTQPVQTRRQPRSSGSD
jgi:hypothetical protein